MSLRPPPAPRRATLVHGAVASLGPDCACPSPCQMVTKGEYEQSVEHMKRPQPTRIELRVGEERLHEDEQEEKHCQDDDGPPHAANDRGDEHQDR